MARLSRSACGPCQKARRRCSGDKNGSTPYSACRLRLGEECTSAEITSHYNREVKNHEVPNFTDIGHAVTQVKPPTTNQYLVVLSYLFLTSRKPYDSDAISRIIAWDDKDWEGAFRPQYRQLLFWWIAIRKDLTQRGGIPAVSIEDMIQQMRYLLSLIGQLSSQQSGFYSEWESSSYPSRPFGMHASIALICYCFDVTQSVQGFESLDFWSYNEGFLFTMLVQLRSSPTFRDRLTSSQLEHMIACLRMTLLGEDNRTYLHTWCVRIDNSDMVLRYYRSAIKALNPCLLPEIQSRWAREQVKESSLTCVQNWDFDDHDMIEEITFALARVFQSACHPMALYDAAKEIPQLMESKPDREVIIEMIHVREWERLHREGLIDEYYWPCFSQQGLTISGRNYSIRVGVVPPLTTEEILPGSSLGTILPIHVSI